MDADTAAVVIAISFLASVAQGVTGFGFALVVVPFFLLVVDVQDAVVMSALLSAANVLILSLRVWKDAPVRLTVRLLIGSVLGMPAGIAALLLVPEDGLRIAVGVIAIAMAAALGLGVRIEPYGAVGELSAGAASGVLRTSTGMAGPPVVLYLQGSGYGPTQFRAALTVFFLLGSVISMVAFAGADVVTGHALVLSAVAVPAVLIGNGVGDRIHPMVNEKAFGRLVLALLVATSLSAIGTSLVSVLT